jgi:hypothetical protein
MPVLVGMIAVLFQFGILFIAYLSLVHELRDIGRWVAVHPDTINGTSCTTPNSMWAQICADAPTVIDPTKITLYVDPAADGVQRDCDQATFAANSNTCPNRRAGQELRLRLHYDAGSIMFLPTTFRFGPWINVALRSSLPDYAYSVMVEQH